jgi:hypothetical protein
MQTHLVNLSYFLKTEFGKVTMWKNAIFCGKEILLLFPFMEYVIFCGKEIFLQYAL